MNEYAPLVDVIWGVESWDAIVQSIAISFFDRENALAQSEHFTSRLLLFPIAMDDMDALISIDMPQINLYYHSIDSVI